MSLRRAAARFVRAPETMSSRASRNRFRFRCHHMLSRRFLASTASSVARVLAATPRRATVRGSARHAHVRRRVTCARTQRSPSCVRASVRGDDDHDDQCCGGTFFVPFRHDVALSLRCDVDSSPRDEHRRRPGHAPMPTTARRTTSCARARPSVRRPPAACACASVRSRSLSLPSLSSTRRHRRGVHRKYLPPSCEQTTRSFVCQRHVVASPSPRRRACRRARAHATVARIARPAVAAVLPAVVRSRPFSIR